MSLLAAAARLVLLALLGDASLGFDRGLATRYGDPGDRLGQQRLSCTNKRMLPGQLVCAHRTLPCGSVVVLENPRNGQLALCQVLDRGPFGAILPDGGWGVKIRRSEPGAWRGLIDLSPAVAKALGHNGRERVRIVYQRFASHLREGRSAPR
jgi:rare lipoprotein A (peptidoglycan hydrolase)